MRQQDLNTIAKMLPFSFLPEERIQSLLPRFSMETHEKGKILFAQEISISGTIKDGTNGEDLFGASVAAFRSLSPRWPEQVTLCSSPTRCR